MTKKGHRVSLRFTLCLPILYRCTMTIRKCDEIASALPENTAYKAVHPLALTFVGGAALSGSRPAWVLGDAMSNVSVSSSRKDIDFARRLFETLSQTGRDSWVDW